MRFDRGARAVTFWYASREPSLREDDSGTEVYLNLVDLAFHPDLPADSTLVVWTTLHESRLTFGSNTWGRPPGPLARHGRRAPITGVRCVRSPTPAGSAPRFRRGAHWRLISHLSLNHLSLADSTKASPRSRKIHSALRLLRPERERRPPRRSTGN